MSTYRGKYPNKIKSVTTFNGSNGSVFCSCLINNGEKYTFSADSLGYDLPNPGDDIQKFIDMSVSNSQKLEDEKDVTIHESNEAINVEYEIFCNLLSDFEESIESKINFLRFQGVNDSNESYFKLKIIQDKIDNRTKLLQFALKHLI